MLAYQFRTLLAVKDGILAKQREFEIVRAAKLHPYVVQKSMPVARRWERNALLAALTRILATDFAIKQGKVEARTGLLLLVLGLVNQKIPVRG